MTITDPATTVVPAAPSGPVAIDLYRDIHKGIRAALFDAVLATGRLDPVDDSGRLDLADRVDGVVDLLVAHAEHEDVHIQPALEEVRGDLAARIADDHHSLEPRMEGLRRVAADAVAAGGADRRAALHLLHLDLAAFAGDYLAHQDLEERVVMPALEVAVGPEATLAIHQAIVSSIPPEEMTTSLAVMLPAMCLDDRAELLGGMRAGAPAEVFEGVWGLAGTVLDGADRSALAARLGLD